MTIKMYVLNGQEIHIFYGSHGLEDLLHCGIERFKAFLLTDKWFLGEKFNT